MQGEGAMAAEQAAAARHEAEAVQIRAKAVEETQAKAVRSKRGCGGYALSNCFHCLAAALANSVRP